MCRDNIKKEIVQTIQEDTKNNMKLDSLLLRTKAGGFFVFF